MARSNSDEDRVGPDLLSDTETSTVQLRPTLRHGRYVVALPIITENFRLALMWFTVNITS